jgi:hypothetical protein
MEQVSGTGCSSVTLVRDAVSECQSQAYWHMDVGTNSLHLTDSHAQLLTAWCAMQSLKPLAG